MCTTASPTEAALIYAIVAGPLAALPVGLAWAAWRKRRPAWSVAAAVGAALPLLFLLRNGPDAASDPAALLIILLFVLGLAAALASTRLPRAALPALLLVAAGALVLVGTLAYHDVTGPTCAEIMAPPTPSSQSGF